MKRCFHKIRGILVCFVILCQFQVASAVVYIIPLAYALLGTATVGSIGYGVSEFLESSGISYDPSMDSIVFVSPEMQSHLSFASTIAQFTWDFVSPAGAQHELQVLVFDDATFDSACTAADIDIFQSLEHQFLELDYSYSDFNYSLSAIEGDLDPNEIPGPFADIFPEDYIGGLDEINPEHGSVKRVFDKARSAVSNNDPLEDDVVDGIFDKIEEIDDFVGDLVDLESYYLDREIKERDKLLGPGGAQIEQGSERNIKETLGGLDQILESPEKTAIERVEEYLKKNDLEKLSDGEKVELGKLDSNISGQNLLPHVRNILKNRGAKLEDLLGKRIDFLEKCQKYFQWLGSPESKKQLANFIRKMKRRDKAK